MTPVLGEVTVTTVLLIAAPVAAALFVLVLIAFAGNRTRPSVAAKLERDAARRDRVRRRSEDKTRPAEVEPGKLEPALVGGGEHASTGAESGEPGTTIAIPEVVGPPATVQTALEEVRRARLVAPPVPRRDPDKAELDRRQFINKGMVGGTVFGLAVFGGASLAFLYPKLGKGFGGEVNAGPAQVAIDYFESNRAPLYNPEGRFYLIPFRIAAGKEADARKVYRVTYGASVAAGVAAVYQKCAHLGCRVPWCLASEWFECPCHGSQYNEHGERQAGPAPRGLERFAFSVAGNGDVLVNTGTPLDAPPPGTNTSSKPTPSQHCV